MSEDWLSIYRRVATDAANERGAENLAASPVFREPASWMDAMRGAWSGENWFGRLTSEDIFGNALHKSYVQSWFPEDELNDPSWTPTQGNFRGVEQFSRELLNTGSRTEFEIKRLNLLDRQMRIETAASRNGVMHQLVAHILDPTIVIGYGVGRAALGLPARVVGARVAAVEAGLVGSQQAMMAARYDDRTAGDAVRAAAYAAAFGFVLGAGISKVMYGTKGKGWATGSMDFGTRQRAAAARQTTMNIVDETLPGTMERTERVARAYAGTTTELDKTLAKQQGTVARLANSLGIKAEDATDEVLAKLYAEGDKATRQRVTRLRKAQDQAAETGRERNLMDLERAAAEFAKDSDTWKSNAFAAIASGRAGIVASMLPRARVTADSIFERGIAGLPDNLNKTLVDAFDGLRTGARILTRSHGLDPGPGKMPGANIEDIHMREITMRMRTDEQLRTAAIHSIRNTAYPHALYTPTVRSVTGVFRWSANKAMELPHVLSGGRRFKVNPLGSAEDELEGWLRKIADEVEVDGKLLKMDHIDVPDAVKALYKFRQEQFQEVGKALRDHNMMYIQRSLNEEYMRMDSEMDLARKAMEEAPAGSREWDQAFDAYDRAMRRMEQIDAQAEAYKLAEDPSYQPVSLMAHKVRADKEGFIKAAMDHFWANPRTVTRQSRFKPGPTKDLPVAMTPLHVEGRALALWHATVWRTDYAGRPVGRQEFIRNLDDVIDELAPGRRYKWADYNEYVSNPKAPPAARPTATTVEEAAADALILRVDGIKQAEALTRGDAGGRYLQSEMFETGRLDPVRFSKFIEDRPTIQFRAYLERELRRVIAAEKLGDPDGMNPLAAAELRMRELSKALDGEAGPVARLKQELQDIVGQEKPLTPEMQRVLDADVALKAEINTALLTRQLDRAALNSTIGNRRGANLLRVKLREALNDIESILGRTTHEGAFVDSLRKELASARKGQQDVLEMHNLLGIQGKLDDLDSLHDALRRMGSSEELGNQVRARVRNLLIRQREVPGVKAILEVLDEKGTAWPSYVRDLLDTLPVEQSGRMMPPSTARMLDDLDDMVRRARTQSTEEAAQFEGSRGLWDRVATLIEEFYAKSGRVRAGQTLRELAETTQGQPVAWRRKWLEDFKAQRGAQAATRQAAESAAQRELNERVFDAAFLGEGYSPLRNELLRLLQKPDGTVGMIDVSQLSRVLEEFVEPPAGANMFDEMLATLKRWQTDGLQNDNTGIFARVNRALKDAKEKRLSLQELDELLQGPELSRARTVEVSAETRKALEDALEELTERSNSYDLLRRQMMGEVLFENSNSFIDKMNTAAGLAANISTAADLGMAGYSVTIDLGQMLAYHGLGPIKLGRLLNEIRKDPIMRKALQDPALRHQLGVAGEVVRGARLRAIQGADSTFGNQGGFLSTGNYFADLGRWTGNLYAEAASNVMNASLLNPITDLTQMLASPLATTRIMQAIGRVATGTGEKIDANILRRIGMEPEMAARVWAQYQDGQKGVFLFGKGKAGGELTDQGAMILPEFSTWRDPQLAEQVMAMIGGDIRVATLHPGIASNRVWQGMGGALQAVGRLYYMFTRWAMVSSANIYGKNIEDGTYQHTATALMYSTIIQAVVNLAKEPDFVTMSLEERLKNAMVMSGGFGYLGIMNERLERISGHQMGLRPLMGIDTFAHDPDSLRFRAQALGPPAGKAAAAIDNIQEGRYGSLGRLFMPYQNWWLWAGAVRIASDRTDALTED